MRPQALQLESPLDTAVTIRAGWTIPTCTEAPPIEPDDSDMPLRVKGHTIELRGKNAQKLRCIPKDLRHQSESQPNHGRKGRGTAAPRRLRSHFTGRRNHPETYDPYRTDIGNAAIFLNEARIAQP
jgi:hypothetical protein